MRVRAGRQSLDLLESERDAVRSIPRIRFDLSALAIDAATRDQGVILTNPHLTGGRAFERRAD